MKTKKLIENEEPKKVLWKTILTTLRRGTHFIQNLIMGLLHFCCALKDTRGANLRL